MAIPTRRTSARLSGGSVNDEQDKPLGIEMLDSMTRKKRTSANGTTIGSEDVPEKQDMVDGTRKRQRTGDKPFGMRKTKTVPFKPVAISSIDTNDEEITPSQRPPPPPPSVRRPARQATTATYERSPSPPIVAIASSTTGQTRKAAASSASQMDAEKANKGKSVVKSSQGSTSFSESAGRPGMDMLEGLEGHGTLQAEALEQRLHWKEMTNEAGAGASITGLVADLEFASSEELMPTLARPLSPPRAAPSATEFQTPRASRRTKVITIDTIEPITLGTTPKDRRKNETEQRKKRQSMSKRGKRMTDLHDEIALPHRGVDAGDFHAHIPTTLPQTARARTLIMWCIQEKLDKEKDPKVEVGPKGKRLVPSQASKIATSKGDEIVASIVQDLFQAMKHGDVDDSIFSGEKKAAESSESAGLPANPRNVANRATQDKFNEDIARDKAEENQWISIFGRVNQHRLQVLEEQKQLLKRQENSEEHSADDIPSFTGREAGIDNLQAWAEMAQEVLQAGDDIEAMPLDDVEYHVDVLHQASHAALQYSATAKRFLDGVFASLAQDVRNRDRSGVSSIVADSRNADREAGAPPSTAEFLAGMRAESSSQPSSGLDILKALSAEDDPSKGAEMMRLLESLPPVPPSVRRPTNPSSTRTGSNPTGASGSGSMTPRRPGAGTGITPRKIGRLGSSTPRRERELSRGPSPSLAA